MTITLHKLHKTFQTIVYVDDIISAGKGEHLQAFRRMYAMVGSLMYAMVGSLMYAMVGTRFDICYAVSVVSQFLQAPKKVHCDLVRHIYRYLRGSPTLKLNYFRDSELKLEGFVDASYANHSSFF